jgi:hypothetical protein
MNKNNTPINRVYASIIVVFGWLIFLSLWLFYYATSFGIIQNIGVLLASIVVVGMVEVLIWVPWAMKQSE